MDFQNLSEEEWLKHRQKETLEYLELTAQLALKKKQLLEQQLRQQPQQPVEPQVEQQPEQPLVEQQVQQQPVQQPEPPLQYESSYWTPQER
jgi:hypothetical protein